MVLSLMPMTVAGQATGRGSIPTIPINRFVAVGPNVVVGADVPVDDQIHCQNYSIRFLEFVARDFVRIGQTTTTSYALITTSNVAQLWASRAQLGTAANHNATRNCLLTPGVPGNILFDNGATQLADGSVLVAQRSIAGVTISVYMRRRGPNEVHSTVIVNNPIGATLSELADVGVSIPIYYVASNTDANPSVTLHWYGGYGGPVGAQPAIQLATRRRVGFDFSATYVDGFNIGNHRLRGQIRIEEQVLGSFYDGWWRIRMTIDRGFSWNRPLSMDGREVQGVSGVERGRIRNLRGESGLSVWPGWQFAGTFGSNFYFVADREGYRTAYLYFPVSGSDHARLADRIDLESLWIVANENARAGNVNVEIGVYHSETRGGPWRREDRGSVVVAQYVHDGILLELCEDADLEDHWLMSGQVDWDYLEIRRGTTTSKAVSPRTADEQFHLTAALTLTERVAGSMSLTGRSEIRFEFPEGIQVLGARFEALDEGLGAYGSDFEEIEVWFIDGREANRGLDYANGPAHTYWNALVGRDWVSIMPEDDSVMPRIRIASLRAEFYLSVEAGFEWLYGTTIPVNVRGRALGDFEQSIVIARAWDPITVETNPVEIGMMDGHVAFGRFIGPIGDIIIHETQAGALRSGTELWIGIEESGLMLGLPTAIAVTAQGVQTDGDSGLRVSARPTRSGDGLGFMVEILTASIEDGAYIRFTGVGIDGAVLPEIEYNIIVGGTSVAHNWFEWSQRPGWGAMWAADHGFFNPEPYPTYAFSFRGVDFYAPDPPTVVPDTPRPPGVTQPVAAQRVGEWMTSFTNPNTGRTFAEFNPLILVRNVEDPRFETSYVMFRVLADILDLDYFWDDASQEGGFTDGFTTVTVYHGARNALVTDASGTRNVPIIASGLQADARLINGRFYLPVAFLRDSGLFGVEVRWYDGPVGSRSITIGRR
jgi:hypothetical protein